jgi:hypothetical protein
MMLAIFWIGKDVVPSFAFRKLPEISLYVLSLAFSISSLVSRFTSTCSCQQTVNIKTRGKQRRFTFFACLTTFKKNSVRCSRSLYRSIRLCQNSSSAFPESPSSCFFLRKSNICKWEAARKQATPMCASRLKSLSLGKSLK